MFYTLCQEVHARLNNPTYENIQIMKKDVYECGHDSYNIIK